MTVSGPKMRYLLAEPQEISGTDKVVFERSGLDKTHYRHKSH
jgi:hypothetical protein